jgi:hypothetical protein
MPSVKWRVLLLVIRPVDTDKMLLPVTDEGVHLSEAAPNCNEQVDRGATAGWRAHDDGA